MAKRSCRIEEGTQRAQTLNNGHFHLVAGHQFAREALQLVNDIYSADIDYRGLAGPVTMGHALMRLYGLEQITNTHISSPAGSNVRHLDNDFLKY